MKEVAEKQRKMKEFWRKGMVLRWVLEIEVFKCMWVERTSMNNYIHPLQMEVGMKMIKARHLAFLSLLKNCSHPILQNSVGDFKIEKVSIVSFYLKC